jgi:ABC-type phosphate transport system substrate-binding protein
MATVRPFVMALLLAWALATAAATAREQPATPPALAIVVNRSNPIENLTFSELRHIFMLDTQTWPHGRKITVVLRDKGQPERTDAIRLICGLAERDYEKHILFRTFQGSVNIGPRAIQSAPAMLRFVFSAPGAIGYVNADEVDGSVKLLRIDGRLPDDPAYPLRHRARGRAGAEEE